MIDVVNRLHRKCFVSVLRSTYVHILTPLAMAHDNPALSIRKVQGLGTCPAITFFFFSRVALLALCPDLVANHQCCRLRVRLTAYAAPFFSQVALVVATRPNALDVAIYARRNTSSSSSTPFLE